MNNNPIIIIEEEDKEDVYLKNLLAKFFPKNRIVKYTDGVEAFNFIEKYGKSSLIISELNIKSINGLQLLKKIRSSQDYSGAYFIILNSSRQKDYNVQALQAGADDIIEKPAGAEVYISRLRAAAKILTARYDIIEEKKKSALLEHEMMNEKVKIAAFAAKMQNAIFPDFAPYIANISGAAKYILDYYGEITDKEKEDIITASPLCLLGKALLPAALINSPVMENGMLSKPEMESIPNNFRELLSEFHGFEDVETILVHIYENWDGSGMPDKYQLAQIPLGARIIRVAVDYYGFFVKFNQNEKKALEQIYNEFKRLYDFRIAALFDQYLASLVSEGKNAAEMKIETGSLLPGMTASRNIVSESGSVLIGAGNKLDDGKIEKIKEIIKSDPLIGSIYIKA